MELANPVFLTGMLAAALPIIIHLAGRRRAREVRFPTLVFVRGVDRALAKRHKLRERIILALRVAALCALALGLALPRLRGDQAGWVGTRETSTVFVIDNSLGMRARVGGLTLLARATQAARAWLAQLGESEKSAVIALCGSEGKTPSLVRDHASVAAEVERVAPTYLSANLGAALTLAAKTLQGDTAPAKQIVVLSDFPDSTTSTLGPLPPDTRVIALAMPLPAGPNLAFRELRALEGAAGESVIRCAVGNSGTAAGRGELTLFAGDKELARRTILVPQGGAATEVFRLKGLADERVRARIECHDDVLPEDNESFVAVRQRAAMRVVLVRDRRSAISYLDETFWVSCALSGRTGGLEVVTVLAKELSRENLERATAVVACGVSAFGEEAVAELRAYVRGGGTVLFVAGDSFDMQAYRGMGTGVFPLFPAIPRDVATLKEATIGRIDERHAALRALLALKPPPNLRSATFTRCVRVEKVAEPAAVLLELDNGLPLLIERPLGEGRTLFLAASMTPQWTTLPLRVAFVPFLHAFVRDAAGRSARAFNLTCGDVLSVSAEGAPAKLVGRNGEIAAGAEDKSLRFGPLAAPGFYAFSRGEEKPAQVVVNVPASESALASLTPGKIKEALGAEAVIALQDPTLAVTRAQALATGKELRNVLLIAMLAIACIEGLLAMWWASRRYVWKRHDT